MRLLRRETGCERTIVESQLRVVPFDPDSTGKAHERTEGVRTVHVAHRLPFTLFTQIRPILQASG